MSPETRANNCAYRLTIRLWGAALLETDRLGSWRLSACVYSYVGSVWPNLPDGWRAIGLCNRHGVAIATGTWIVCYLIAAAA